MVPSMSAGSESVSPSLPCVAGRLRLGPADAWANQLAPGRPVRGAKPECTLESGRWTLRVISRTRIRLRLPGRAGRLRVPRRTAFARHEEGVFRSWNVAPNERHARIPVPKTARPTGGPRPENGRGAAPNEVRGGRDLQPSPLRRGREAGRIDDAHTGERTWTRFVVDSGLTGGEG